MKCINKLASRFKPRFHGSSDFSKTVTFLKYCGNIHSIFAQFCYENKKIIMHCIEKSTKRYLISQIIETASISFFFKYSDNLCFIHNFRFFTVYNYLYIFLHMVTRNIKKHLSSKIMHLFKSNILVKSDIMD